MEQNKWKIATGILVLVSLLLVVGIINKNKEIDFGDFQIKEDRFNYFMGTFDASKSLTICEMNSPTDKCLILYTAGK